MTDDAPFRLARPPRTTVAYTPTFPPFPWTAVRSTAGSLGRLPWLSVVMTQRGQGPSTRNCTPPSVSARPAQPFSTNPPDPSVSSITTFGQKRGTSKRLAGDKVRRRSRVAVVTRWTAAQSKNVPDARGNSNTSSRWASQSWSGQ